MNKIIYLDKVNETDGDKEVYKIMNGKIKINIKEDDYSYMRDCNVEAQVIDRSQLKVIEQTDCFNNFNVIYVRPANLASCQYSQEAYEYDCYEIGLVDWEHYEEEHLGEEIEDCEVEPEFLNYVATKKKK